MQILQVDFALKEALLEELLVLVEEILVQSLKLLSCHVVGEVDVVEETLD